MLGSGLGVLAMSGLPARCLPAVDLPLTLRVLAVALVPAAGLILASTPLAETNPRARSAPSGRSAVLWRTLTGAHGRYCSQGKARGGCPTILLERDQKAKETLICESIALLRTRQKMKRSETCASEGEARIDDSSGGSLQTIEDGSDFPIGISPRRLPSLAAMRQPD